VFLRRYLASAFLSILGCDDVNQRRPRASLWLLLSSGLIFGTFLGLLILGDPTNFNRADQTWQAGKQSNPAVGEPAPDFSLRTLDGAEISLADFREQILLINFWATWCGPCKIEMPAIQTRADRFPTQLTVLAIDADESEVLVRDFVEELGLTFLVAIDRGGVVQRNYLVRGLPTTYFVDGDGIIRVHHIGLMSDAQLDDYLELLGVSE
jgi:cytochrome c biogenesis protein CcmG, thiol:disulfide interchange protein DsbE